MAFTAARKSGTTSIVKANPLKPKLAKAEDRLRNLSKRTREEILRQEEAVISVGTALAFGVMKGKGVKIPTVMGLDPDFVWGLGLTLLGPRVLAGKNGKRLEAAGVGLLSSAANRAGQTGTVKVGEDGGDDGL